MKVTDFIKQLDSSVQLVILELVLYTMVPADHTLLVLACLPGQQQRLFEVVLFQLLDHVVGYMVRVCGVLKLFLHRPSRPIKRLLLVGLLVFGCLLPLHRGLELGEAIFLVLSLSQERAGRELSGEDCQAAVGIGNLT